MVDEVLEQHRHELDSAIERLRERAGSPLAGLVNEVIRRAEGIPASEVTPEEVALTTKRLGLRLGHRAAYLDQTKAELSRGEDEIRMPLHLLSCIELPLPHLSDGETRSLLSKEIRTSFHV